MKARCDREVSFFPNYNILLFVPPCIRHCFFKTESLNMVEQSKEHKKVSIYGTSIHERLDNSPLVPVTNLLMHRHMQFMSFQRSNAFLLPFQKCAFLFFYFFLRCKRKKMMQNVSTTAKPLLTSQKNKQVCLHGKVKMLYQGKRFSV